MQVAHCRLPRCTAPAHRRPRVALRSQAVSVAVAQTERQAQTQDVEALERQVLQVLSQVKGRGKSGLSPEQQQALEAAFEGLEQVGGVENPTNQPELTGRWKLLFTSRPGSASPIQNTFTGVEAFKIYQEVDLLGPEPRVNNVVDFGSLGELKVEAEASTEGRPLEGFTPREDKGDFLFGIFGRSSTYEPSRPNSRIWFQFDRAAFRFSFLPFKLPYPVPFRLLGDERKGFIDTTYMNQEGTFRLSRGNKGTLFVLLKDVPLKELLSKAIEAGDDARVSALLDLLTVEGTGTPAPARSPKAAGTWRLVWSQQASNASPLQKFGSKQANSFQVIDGETGVLQNLVDLGFLRITAEGDTEPASDTRTTVAITRTQLTIGEGSLPKPITIPLPGPRAGTQGGSPGYVDWLYLDDTIRVTRGNKGSLFVHTRE